MPQATNPGPQGPSPRFRPPRPSKASRNIPLKSPASCRGAIVFPEPRPRSCVFESALEEKTALVILARRDVVELVDQPEAVAYEVDGKRLEHTFDYLVTLRDGRRLAIAVKPERFVRSRGLDATMRTIAAQMPRTFADGIVTVSEAKIDPVLVANARLVHSVRRDPPSSLDAVVLRVAATLNGAVPISVLAAMAGAADGRGFRAVVRQIAAGFLSAPRGVRLEPETLVERNTGRNPR